MEEGLRIAKTEALFRSVNERIAETAERFESEEAEFVCECSDTACIERVEARLDDYEQVRSDGTHFLLVPGHEDTRIERVVGRRRRYAIVEKWHRSVARHVRRFDPRGQPA